MSIAAKINRHQLVVRAEQDALERPVGGVEKRGIHLVGRGLAIEERRQIDRGDVRRGDAHRDAVEPPLELRQHFAHSRRRAGRGRDNRERGRPRAPKVLVRQIEQVLIVGVGVDRGHPALADAEPLVQHLGDRRQAVRGARRVGDDVVLRRVVLIGIDPDHDRYVRVLGRRRDDDALRASRQVFGGGVPACEEPGGLEHDVHAEILPRQLRRVLDRQHLEFVVFDPDGALACLHARLEVPEHGVVFQQVRQRRRVRQIVHRDEVDVAPAERCPHDVAPDPPEPVDADFHRH